MMHLKRRAACLLAVMLMAGAPAGIASGAEIALNNEMELDIKAVYCVDDAGVTKQAAGAIKAEASITVPSDKFPEYECNRIAVQAADGSAWQFYQEPEPGAATEIIFSMDKANPNAEVSYPSLVIESGGENYVSPAGVPLSFLVQAMEFGLDETTWKNAATPGADKSEDPGAFAVSFADVSWSLVGDGLVFSPDLVPGKELAESANLVANCSNSTFMAIFEGLKNFGTTPWALAYNEDEAALTSEGAALLPDAEVIDDTETDEKRWEAVIQFLGLVADANGEDLPRFVFGNDTLIFDLVIDLEDGSATLTITRREGAAFG
ncbi:hypothetical protein LJC48_06365 [Desulfovibrio sp. OttesenSCG-928-C06]|nr:hypothetical protein [Desulfovibrio sp. OttesenSCG-928-C06]